jgi:hypothetical protein
MAGTRHARAGTSGGRSDGHHRRGDEQQNEPIASRAGRPGPMDPVNPCRAIDPAATGRRTVNTMAIGGHEQGCEQQAAAGCPLVAVMTKIRDIA